MGLLAGSLVMLSSFLGHDRGAGNAAPISVIFRLKQSLHKSQSILGIRADIFPSPLLVAKLAVTRKAPPDLHSSQVQVVVTSRSRCLLEDFSALVGNAITIGPNRLDPTTTEPALYVWIGDALATLEVAAPNRFVRPCQIFKLQSC